MRCKHCGSELHWPAECPPRERAVRTAEVTIGGVTTQYVNRMDYDYAVRDAQMKIANLELELARARTPFVPVSSLHYKCDCGAVCSSRENLVSHVQYEAIHSKGFKVRERHVKFAAAIDTLYPPCKSRCADCP